MNRTKALVLAFFAAYWVMVVTLMLAARPLYDQILSLSGNQAQAEIPVLAVLTILFTTLSIGVIRGWRWTFWLIVTVFMVGLLRALYSALQLTGILPRQGPVWYVVLPGPIGLIQFCIAVVMLAGYRRVGGWGRRSSRP